MDLTQILVSVVVPCRNEAGNIGRLLGEIQAQEGLPGRMEVLIADGCSDDATGEIVRLHVASHPNTRLLMNEGRIVSTGLNLAIRETRGEYIVRMDAHSSYARDYIKSCLEVMRETGAANVGGAARSRAEGRMPRAIAAAYASPFAVGAARFHFPDFEGKVDTVPFGCWRRDYLVKIGPFDESLVRNQDDELNLRIARAGGLIWQSRKIRSWYQPRLSTRQLFMQYFQYGFWKIAVVRKHGAPVAFRHVVPMIFVLSLLIGVCGVPFFGIARLLLMIDLLLYGLFILSGAARIAMAAGWDLFPLLLVVLPTFHVAYGLGSISGVLGLSASKKSRLATGLSR